MFTYMLFPHVWAPLAHWPATISVWVNDMMFTLGCSANLRVRGKPEDLRLSYDGTAELRCKQSWCQIARV